MHNLLRPAGEIRASLKLICSFAFQNAECIFRGEWSGEREREEWRGQLVAAVDAALEIFEGHGPVDDDDRGLLVLREQQEDVLTVLASSSVD